MYSTARLVQVNPRRTEKEQALFWNELGLLAKPDFNFRYRSLPAIAAIVDDVGIPIPAPTFFLLSHAVRSRGVTGDTSRTYGEALLPWLRFLANRKQGIASATEEDLKLYRADQVFGDGRGHRTRATATANLRVTVAVEFHRWCQRNAYQSPLGSYLASRSAGDRSLAPRIIRRHPRTLSMEEVRRLMLLARTPYRLAFQWSLVTGMRRFEVADLRFSDLPRVMSQDVV